LEQLAKLALAVDDQRSEQRDLAVLGQRQQLADDLLGALRLDRVAAQMAVLDADPGEQHPQVVVDLGDGPDRRARVVRRGLLFDRDGRREPRDVLDPGPLELTEELPGIGREALDVAGLALGVEGVERQARLARPADSREHHQLALGHAQLLDLEVVLGRASNLDPVRLTGGGRAGAGSGFSRACGRLLARGRPGRAASALRGAHAVGGHRGGTVTDSPFSARAKWRSGVAFDPIDPSAPPSSPRSPVARSRSIERTTALAAGDSCTFGGAARGFGSDRLCLAVWA